MSKFVSDTVLDQALDYLKQNVDKLTICDGEPDNYSDASTLKSNGGNKLGDTSLGTSDLTLSDGDTSGRKLKVTGQSGAKVEEDGTADHIALIDDTNSELLLASPLTQSRDVVGEEEYNTESFDEEILSP